jgi:hypothetical protein
LNCAFASMSRGGIPFETREPAPGGVRQIELPGPLVSETALKPKEGVEAEYERTYSNTNTTGVSVYTTIQQLQSQ